MGPLARSELNLYENGFILMGKIFTRTREKPGS